MDDSFNDLNQTEYNPQGSDPQGYNPQGYNAQGYNPQGYNPQGYYQPGYEQGGYGYSNYSQGYSPVAEPKKSNTKSVVSLILGIVGLVLCCCLGAPAVILGAIGVILAILSKNDNQGQMDGMAIAGLIVSIISFVAGLITLCFYIYCFITDPEMSESVRIVSSQLLNGYLLS